MEVVWVELKQAVHAVAEVQVWQLEPQRLVIGRDVLVEGREL